MVMSLPEQDMQTCSRVRVEIPDPTTGDLPKATACDQDERSGVFEMLGKIDGNGEEVNGCRRIELGYDPIAVTLDAVPETPNIGQETLSVEPCKDSTPRSRSLDRSCGNRHTVADELSIPHSDCDSRVKEDEREQCICMARKLSDFFNFFPGDAKAKRDRETLIFERILPDARLFLEAKDNMIWAWREFTTICENDIVSIGYSWMLLALAELMTRVERGLLNARNDVMRLVMCASAKLPPSTSWEEIQSVVKPSSAKLVRLWIDDPNITDENYNLFLAHGLSVLQKAASEVVTTSKEPDSRPSTHLSSTANANIDETLISAYKQILKKFGENCNLDPTSEWAIAARNDLFRRLAHGKNIDVKKEMLVLSECLSRHIYHRFCKEYKMNPDSEWAQIARDDLLKRAVDGPLDEKNELLRLSECLSTESSPDSTWEELSLKKDMRAQRAAQILLREEEAEKAAKKAAKNRPSKKSLRKQALKKRQEELALRQEELARIDEGEEDGKEPADTPLASVVQLSDVGEAIPTRDDAALSSITAIAGVPPPPMELPAAFVDLSDLKSSLVDKNDDVATSVATALQCVVCLKNERSTACVPCGHRCLCEECADRVKIHQCPMCRREIDILMRVFG